MTTADTKYLEVIQEGLRHVGGHAAYLKSLDLVDHPATMIEEGRGSRDGCIRNLERHYRARAIMSWFGRGDLHAFKQESYVASKLMYIREKEADELGLTLEQEYFHCLMSDCAPLLQVFTGFRPGTAEGVKLLNNPKEHLYRHYQMTLALRGEWELLAQRAQEQLDAQPKGMTRFIVDQRFYLALAHGDKAGMAAALTELTSPKMAKVRNDQPEFGFTHFFIGTHATIYAKIAWRAGHEIELDTPYIPKEWLPMTPLEKYEDPYLFMREYDQAS